MRSSIIVPAFEALARWATGGAKAQLLFAALTATKLDLDADPAKLPVRVASAAAIADLSDITVADFDGTAQGVTLVEGDRVLVKDNASPDGIIAQHGKYNGIYIVGAVTSGSAALTRDTDADTSAKMVSGTSVFITEGTYAAKVYALTTANPITLGTTALTFGAQATTMADALAGAKGAVQLAGDLAGAGSAAATPRVGKVNSTSIPATPAIGESLIASSTTSAVWSKQVGAFHTVRGICTSNMSIAAFVGVAGGTAQDGVTYAAGERVLLAGQTTPAENGIYVVGTVGAGTAPLTRAADWFTAAVLPAGSEVAVNEGTLWANTKWFATLAGAITVGTSAPAFYPRQYTVNLTAMAGSPGIKAVTTAWILSATKSAAIPVVKAPGGTPGFLSVGALTPGAGDGSFTVTSTQDETSTLQLTISN